MFNISFWAKIKENIQVCVTGPLWGDSIGQRWDPLTKD